MQQATVSIDDLPELKKAYEKAVASESKQFVVPLKCGMDGEFITQFAKYLIEHLENVSAGMQKIS